MSKTYHLTFKGQVLCGGGREDRTDCVDLKDWYLDSTLDIEIGPLDVCEKCLELSNSIPIGEVLHT